MVFRSANGSIQFHAFRSRDWGNDSGAEIITQGVDFEAARIDVRHFHEAWNQTCAGVSGWDDDRNDHYVDSYNSAYLWGDEPLYIVALCRAQWDGQRISGIVTAGHECFDVGSEPLPYGYPEDWPPLHPIPTGDVEIEPSSLTLYARADRPTARGHVRIENTYATAKEVKVGPIEIRSDSGSTQTGPAGTFKNTQGVFTLHPGDDQLIEVSFTGQAVFGTAFARMPVSWDGGTTFVYIEGTVLPVIG